MSPATTWIESSVNGDNWQGGVPNVGSTPVRVLFGAIIFNQQQFEGESATTFTESSISATSFTEASVGATSWTESGT